MSMIVCLYRFYQKVKFFFRLLIPLNAHFDLNPIDLLNESEH